MKISKAVVMSLASSASRLVKAQVEQMDLSVLDGIESLKFKFKTENYEVSLEIKESTDE